MTFKRLDYPPLAYIRGVKIHMHAQEYSPVWQRGANPE
jgi:hypothetical protein